jgi:hypothetical protein
MSTSVATLCSTCLKLAGVLSEKLNTIKIYKLIIKLQRNISNMLPKGINRHEKEHDCSSKFNLCDMNEIMNLKSEKPSVSQNSYQIAILNIVYLSKV